MKVSIVVWKEDDMFIAKEVITGVVSQGKSVEEAIDNLKEALELYLEEFPDEINMSDVVFQGVINVKTPKLVRI